MTNIFPSAGWEKLRRLLQFPHLFFPCLQEDAERFFGNKSRFVKAKRALLEKASPRMSLFTLKAKFDLLTLSESPPFPRQLKCQAGSGARTENTHMSLLQELLLKKTAVPFKIKCILRLGMGAFPP